MYHAAATRSASVKTDSAVAVARRNQNLAWLAKPMERGTGWNGRPVEGGTNELGDQLAGDEWNGGPLGGFQKSALHTNATTA